MHQQTQSQLASYAPVPETLNIDELQSLTPAQQFFQKRTITFVVPGKKNGSINLFHLYIAGNLLKRLMLKYYRNLLRKQKKSEHCHENNKQKRPIVNKVQTNKSRTNNKQEPLASTSGLNQVKKQSVYLLSKLRQ